MLYKQLGSPVQCNLQYQLRAYLSESNIGSKFNKAVSKGLVNQDLIGMAFSGK